MTATAFASTFAFFPNAQSQTKNAKELASKPTTTVQTDNKFFTADRHDTTTKDRRATANSGFKKCGGQWVIEQLYFNQTFVLADSLSLRNPALLKPAKR